MRRSVFVHATVAAQRSYEAVEIFLRPHLCRLDLYQHLGALAEQLADYRYLFVVQRKPPLVIVETLSCGGHYVLFYLVGLDRLISAPIQSADPRRIRVADSARCLKPVIIKENGANW
jgi:hypothetical protein